MTEPPSPPEDTEPAEPERRGAEDARLVAALRAGDPDAFGRLYDKWFDRVHDLAFRILYDQEAAADVAQDAFVAAWRGIDTLDDDHAFGGWLLRIGRNGALNRKRKEQRSRPVDETQLAMIERAQTRPEDLLGTIDDPAQVAANASVAALLWDAADALGERDRDVLDLQLRHGLTPNEVAEVVGLNRNAANQLVHRVRQRLGTAVGARTLWRDGTPSCAALRAELVAAEADEFDADAVRVIDRHANVCAECEGRRKQRLSPAAMFAALPILSLPALKAKVAAALMAQGAPMQGSTAPADAAAHPVTTELHPMSRAVNHTGRWRRFALGAVAAAAVILFATWVGASATRRQLGRPGPRHRRGTDRRHIRDDLDDHHDHRRRTADVADRAESDRVTTRARRPDRSTGDGPTGDQPTGGDDRTAHRLRRSRSRSPRRWPRPCISWRTHRCCSGRYPARRASP